MSAAERPSQIGITGGIGAGKSMVCRFFQLLGIPVFDADSQAKRLMHNDKSLVQAIKGLLGEKAYLSNHSLNTPYISEQVFQHPHTRLALESIVHPALEKHYTQWVRQQQAPYVIKEAALLFETGSYRTLNATVLVSAPLALRLQRVLKRDLTRSIQDIRRIMKQQWSEKKKQALSAFIIKNNEQTALIPQILALHTSLQSAPRKPLRPPQAT